MHHSLIIILCEKNEKYIGLHTRTTIQQKCHDCKSCIGDK